MRISFLNNEVVLRKVDGDMVVPMENSWKNGLRMLVIAQKK